MVRIFWLWLPDDQNDLCPFLVSAHRTDSSWGVQSRELEGRNCHVSLFAREPSFLQRSTTLSPCTLFSPNSGPTWSALSSHPMTSTLILMLIMLFFSTLLIVFLRMVKPTRNLAAVSSLTPELFFCPPLESGWHLPKTGLLWHREESHGPVHHQEEAGHRTVPRALAVCWRYLAHVQQCLVVQPEDVPCLQVLL